MCVWVESCEKTIKQNCHYGWAVILANTFCKTVNVSPAKEQTLYEAKDLKSKATKV